MGLLRKCLRAVLESAASPAAAALLALCLGGSLPAGAASSKPPAPSVAPATPVVAPPMQFIRVVGAQPDCQPNCPEWISAEGQIMVGTGETFARFVAGLGGRRLPILISSPGGSMADAMAMGRLIRARRLAVAVARTDWLPCPPDEPKCAPSRGVARLSGSICLSACPVVLAGGVERYVSGLSAIGVHQIRLGSKTMVERLFRVRYRIVDGKKEEISRTLTSEKRSSIAPTSADLSSADTTVAKYLAEMGVGDSIVKAMLATPPSGIDLLTNAELVSSRLATLWMLDRPFASAVGPEGLAGVPVGSSSILAATFVASPAGRILGEIDGRRANVEGALEYRRGGGTVWASFALVDARSEAPFPRPGPGSYFVPIGKAGALLFDEPRPGEAASGRIPLRDFCRMRGARLYVAFIQPTIAAGEERARERLALIDVAKAPGAAALFDEACPPGGLAAR